MSFRILVTGGGGYIGSILTPALLSQGHAVTVLDNFRYRQNSLLDCCSNERLEIIRGDCRDEATMRRAMRSADYILPLAAIVGAPICDADRVAAKTTNLDAVRLAISIASA